MIKKIVSLILAVFLILPVTLPEVSANEGKDYNKIYNKDLNPQEKTLVKLLKKEKIKDRENLERIFKRELKAPQKEVEKEINKLKDSPPFPGIDIEKLKSMRKLDFNDYLRENIKNGNFKVEEISENISIIFTNENLFFVEIYEIEGDLALQTDNQESLTSTLTNNILQPKSADAATYYTGTVSKTYVAYSWVGLPLWEIYTKGEFRYDKSTVTPYFYDGWVKKRFTGFIWQIDNYGEGTTIAADGSWATVYTRANFHYGLEYSGIGLVVQYLDVRNQIKCDKYGNIFKDTIIR